MNHILINIKLKHKCLEVICGDHNTWCYSILKNENVSQHKDVRENDFVVFETKR